MAKAQLASAPSSRGRKQNKKPKTCKYPGCNAEFMGIGAAKYCEEHRKPEYRKKLNDIKNKNKAEDMTRPQDSNIIINHSYAHSTVITRTCLCGAEYEITLFPNVDIYPKFCEKHRNPYQRDLLLAQHKTTSQDYDNETVILTNVEDLDVSVTEELELQFGDDFKFFESN